jgi:2,5-diamino-6-(ribosylamino)-4(3H)-pyrimidinone 5'-phosphate reductase
MARRPDLPFVYINVATTADGKLAPANRHFVPFGSKRDQELLLELRAGADAVMSGARTVGPMPVNLGPGPAKYRKMRLRKGLPEFNLRVVVSGSGNLNPKAEIFRHRFSPIIVLVTRRAPESKLRRLREVADEVKAFGDNKLNFTHALRWLRQKWGVKRLLCEGGGEVNAGLFQERLVDEVYHTLCPIVFGGRHAPTMADGQGFPTLASAARLRLKSLKRVGDELFLVWRAVK